MARVLIPTYPEDIHATAVAAEETGVSIAGRR
jgi:hypothetical protein